MVREFDLLHFFLMGSLLIERRILSDSFCAKFAHTESNCNLPEDLFSCCEKLFDCSKVQIFGENYGCHFFLATYF